MTIRTVMVSSTAVDLPQHRERLIEAIQRVGFVPVPMEHLAGADTNLLGASLELVRKSDLYLGIFAFRYGRRATSSDMSLTEAEYREAVRLKKPRRVFFMSDEHSGMRPKDFDRGEDAERLERLKAEIANTDRTPAYFSSVDDLFGKALQALFEVRDAQKSTASTRDASKPTKDKVQGSLPAPPEAMVAHPYSLMETARLVGRGRELQEISQWANLRIRGLNLPIMIVHAVGGMGKSALTWEWFKNHSAAVTPGFAGRFWWSFYEENAGFGNFVRTALAYITGESLDDVDSMRRSDQESLLWGALDRSRFLVVLDGFERALAAYNTRQTSEALADQNGRNGSGSSINEAHAGEGISKAINIGGRRMTDPHNGTFLRKLAMVQHSKLLISSRLLPADLETVVGALIPGVTNLQLEGLEDERALELWREFGVSGSRPALLELFRSIEGYPLLIRAMAGAVARSKLAPGNYDHWKATNAQFNPFDLDLVQRKTHILLAALDKLDDISQRVLETLSSFRMPTNYSTLHAVLHHPDQPVAEADLIDALADLEERGLIGWDRVNNRYDMHPVVRGVVWSRISTPNQDKLYERLEAHFQAAPNRSSSVSVETIDELAETIELFHTLAGRRRYDEAFRLYRDELKYSIRRLGGSGLQSQLLGSLYDVSSPTQPGKASIVKPRLRDAENDREASLLLGYSLGELGDLTTGLAMMRHHNATCPDPLCPVHQTRYYRAAGRLNECERIIKDALAKISNNADQLSEFLVLSVLVSYLTERGEINLSRKAVARMTCLKESGLEGTRPQDEIDDFFLSSQVELAHCMGEYSAALKKAKERLAVAIDARAISRYAQCNSSIAWSYRRLGELDLAEEHYRKALEISDEHGDHWSVFMMRLSLADTYLLRGQLETCRETLADLLTIGDGLGQVYRSRVLLTFAKLLFLIGDYNGSVREIETCLRCYLIECDTPVQFYVVRDALTHADELKIGTQINRIAMTLPCPADWEDGRYQWMSPSPRLEKVKSRHS